MIKPDYANIPAYIYLMESKAAHTMYYLAILCPHDVDEQILHFKNYMRENYGCTAALKSPAHITLVAPFWYDETNESELRQTLQSFKTDLDEAEIHLNSFSHFNRRVLFVNVEPNPLVEELKNESAEHFIDSVGSSIRKDDRPFHPHVTIATRDIKPGDFVKAWEYFSGKTFKVSFVATTISLLKLVSGKWSVIEEKNWKRP